MIRVSRYIDLYVRTFTEAEVQSSYNLMLCCVLFELRIRSVHNVRLTENAANDLCCTSLFVYSFLLAFRKYVAMLKEREKKHRLPSTAFIRKSVNIW